MLETLAALAILAGIGWFWSESLRARETAAGACRQYCKAHELQFLDDTVALSHFELTRSRERLFGIRRVYEFEFSQVGTDRRVGSVTITGHRLESVYLPLLDDP